MTCCACWHRRRIKKYKLRESVTGLERMRKEQAVEIYIGL